jgi:hypothetical protein
VVHSVYFGAACHARQWAGLPEAWPSLDRMGHVV